MGELHDDYSARFMHGFAYLGEAWKEFVTMDA
jgi:hypothetical protein